MKKKKFISIIWGYHKQIFTFGMEQNYHMLPLEAMQEEGYECEIYAINSQVTIEDDPNFIPGIKVIYYKNIFLYIYYLYKNRNAIIYSNSITIKTLLVGIIGKYTVFMAHDQVVPLVNKKIKRFIVLFFYKFFTKIRCINSDEQLLLKHANIQGDILPLCIENNFLSEKVTGRSGGIFIGNLYHDKNPEFLIETCKILKDHGIKFSINILGEDRYNKNGNNFQDLIHNSGLDDYITLLGFIPHGSIDKYIKKSLIYINSSTSEGQCIASFESALGGNALCLQDIISFPSVFGNNALYHRTANELANNIIFYLNHNDIMISSVKNNQKMILDKYNFHTIRSETKKLFLTI